MTKLSKVQLRITKKGENDLCIAAISLLKNKDFQEKCKISSKKFGGFKKSHYFCIRNREIAASVAQLVRAPDC